jgi:hypothetical protein
VHTGMSRSLELFYWRKMRSLYRSSVMRTNRSPRRMIRGRTSCDEPAAIRAAATKRIRIVPSPIGLAEIVSK